MKRILLATIGLSLCVAWTGNARAQMGDEAKTDVIIKKDGSSFPAPGSNQTIEVVKETFEEIHLKMKTGRMKLPTTEIRQILHYDEPAEFSIAMRELKNGNYEKAIQSLNSITQIPREWLRIYTIFYKAEAYRMMGQVKKDANKKAITLYRQLLSKYPNNIFKAQAMLGIAIATFQAGKAKEALQALEKMKTSIPSGGKWDAIADLWKARMLEKEGKYAEAKSVYQQVSFLLKDADLKTEAKIGEIRCIANQKQYESALQSINMVIGNTTNRQILSYAWLVKGDCLQALAGNDVEKTLDAAITYLHAVVFGRDPDVVAEASYKAASCFERAGDIPKAIRHYKESIRNNPSSEWARKAKDKLKELMGGA